VDNMIVELFARYFGTSSAIVFLLLVLFAFLSSITRGDTLYQNFERKVRPKLLGLIPITPVHQLVADAYEEVFLRLQLSWHTSPDLPNHSMTD
jgi:hypothetical protein